MTIKNTSTFPAPDFLVSKYNTGTSQNRHLRGHISLRRGPSLSASVLPSRGPRVLLNQRPIYGG